MIFSDFFRKIFENLEKSRKRRISLDFPLHFLANVKENQAKSDVLEIFRHYLFALIRFLPLRNAFGGARPAQTNFVQNVHSALKSWVILGVHGFLHFWTYKSFKNRKRMPSIALFFAVIRTMDPPQHHTSFLWLILSVRNYIIQQGWSIGTEITISQDTLDKFFFAKKKLICTPNSTQLFK